MEIYQRLLNIVELFENNSQAQLAKKLDIPQSTFFGYLNHKGQSKIRITLLEKVLQVYPQVNKQWLYFGEGEMLKGEVSLPSEEGKFHTPVEETATNPNDESFRIHALETEVMRLQGDLIDAKDEIIALQKKIMCQLPAWEVHGEASENFNGSHQLPVKTAAATPSVARLQRQKIE